MGIPDSELVRPASTLEILKCMICSEVLLDPRECGECQVAFCLECISEWTWRHPSCPHCMTCIHSLNDLEPLHRNTRTELDKLEVKCLRYGCRWTGRLDSRAGHECTPDMIISLTQQLAQRDERIAALEAQLAEQAALIQDLTRVQDEEEETRKTYCSTCKERMNWSSTSPSSSTWGKQWAPPRAAQSDWHGNEWHHDESWSSHREPRHQGGPSSDSWEWWQRVPSREPRRNDRWDAAASSSREPSSWGHRSWTPSVRSTSRHDGSSWPDRSSARPLLHNERSSRRDEAALGRSEGWAWLSHQTDASVLGQEYQ
mmetsp:Transcript_24779/g.45441  ORF Transcript_24779/g.45441 Transcript_24779/m.45441 type:complete len:314 (+) Transcript_24779:65-1006(+)